MVFFLDLDVSNNANNNNNSPIMLYGLECWTVNKAEVLRIDALDQWCLRQILNIQWHDFVINDDIHRMTEQPHFFPSSREDVFHCLDI